MEPAPLQRIRAVVSPDRLSTALALVLAVLVATGLGAAPATAATSHQDDTAESLVVEVHEGGDATITLTLTYDLETDDERDAFRSLQQSESDRQELLDRLESRLAGVADQASQRADRGMSVSAVEVSLTREDDVGAIHLVVEWENLAAERDGSIVLEEPFASGFEAEQPVTVVAPDGYEVESATPTPDESGDGYASWGEGTELDGFEVVLAQPSGNPLPGFGALAALVGALVAVALLGRRGGR